MNYILFITSPLLKKYDPVEDTDCNVSFCFFPPLQRASLWKTNASELKGKVMDAYI